MIACFWAYCAGLGPPSVLYFLRSPRFVWTSLSARPFWEAAPDPEVFPALAVVLCLSGIATALSLRRLARETAVSRSP